MISNLLVPTIILSFVLFPLPTLTFGSTNAWNTGDISQEEEEVKIEPISFEINNKQYEEYKKTTLPNIQNFYYDLDGNDTDERIIIKSYPGFPGDQNTEIFINSNPNPIFTEVGSFYAFNAHKMDSAGNYIAELQLQTGQSLNALFYSYHDGELERVSVSTENPPSWHGIISRSIPEFEDINNDGELELLAYYNFLNDPTRTVEVYEYSGGSFNLIQKYEEVLTPS